MEIKHTVEILTKDIQEIEKLVRNLNNSPAPSRIDLDLALSKLRHVYELLSMIRLDADTEAISERSESMDQSKKEVATVKEQNPVTETLQENMPEPDEIHWEEPVNEIPEPAESVPSEIHPPVEPIKTRESQIEVPFEQPVAKKKEAAILAEKFNNEKRINENMSSSAGNGDVTSKISGQPIDNIGRNIGINDRFLIIRELLNGDGNSFNQLINDLDTSNGAEEALSILEAKFPDKSEHEGFLLLTHLARRKFIPR